MRFFAITFFLAALAIASPIVEYVEPRGDAPDKKDIRIKGMFPNSTISISNPLSLSPLPIHLLNSIQRSSSMALVAPPAPCQLAVLAKTAQAFLSRSRSSDTPP